MHEDFLSELPAESAALLDLGVALSAGSAGFQRVRPSLTCIECAHHPVDRLDPLAETGQQAEA